MDGLRFDTLARTLSIPNSRRAAVHTIAAAGIGLGLSWLGRNDAAAARKKKGNGKNTVRKPRKPKTPAPPTDAEPDICDTTWPDSGNRNYCRFIREQCPRDPEELGPFCIVNRNIDDVIHQVADCCPPGFSCCDGTCVNLETDDGNCGSSCADRNACGAGEICRDGRCLQICRSSHCPPALGCVTSRGYLCDGQIGGDCQCGCGPGLKHCHHPQVGWVCASENSSFC